MTHNLTPVTISEAKRRGAADVVEKLRLRLSGRRDLYQTSSGTDFDYMAGVLNGLTIAMGFLDELCPPADCDNPPTAGVVGESMQHEINYAAIVLMTLGPSDLRKLAQRLTADDPAQAERLRQALYEQA